MEIQRVNRDDPERIFMSFKNSYSTASMTPGQWAAHDVVTDADGVAVTKPGGRDRNLIAGVVNHTIAHNGFGLVQVWGFRADARCSGGSGLNTSKLSAGRPMVFATSGFQAQAVALTSATVVDTEYAKRMCGYALTAANTAAKSTSGTTAIFKVMITCL